MQVDLIRESASVGASKNYCNVYIRFKIKSESFVKNLKTYHLLLGPSNQVLTQDAKIKIFFCHREILGKNLLN